MERVCFVFLVQGRGSECSVLLFHAGSMQAPCRLHAGSMQAPYRFRAGFMQAPCMIRTGYGKFALLCCDAVFMMRKKKLRTFVFITLYLMFLLLMDYPYLSRIYNDAISGNVVSSCTRSESMADCDRRLEQAFAYNRYLAGTKAWSGSDSEWNKAARILCLDDSDLAGWIRIPALDLILPLSIGTKEDALNEGAGILEGSSLPVGGEDTHTCISAHRGLPDRTLFTNLDMLRNHDRIEVHTLGRTIFYEVFGNETVLPSKTDPLRIRPGEDLLTLITCTPYGINTHRLYVHARRVEEDEAEADERTKRSSFLEHLQSPVFWKLWWWIPATVLLLLSLILLVRKA